MPDPIATDPSPELTRRHFLRASGAVGAGAAALGAGAAVGASAPRPAAADTAGTADRGPGVLGGSRRWRVDTEATRFTIAVMPDTQYLFDGDSLHPEPVAASLAYLARRQRELNLAFVAHLGDVVQNGARGEVAAASAPFEALDRAGAAWSVLAGNHDIDERTDDQRGRTPFLDAFGPKRFADSPSFRGACPGGYNTFHTFRAAGREWLVLSLDWRLSEVGAAWARSVLTAHRTLPTIVVSHELVTSVPGTTRGELSPYGATVWDRVVRAHDQVFLTLNGHDWPSARTVLTNDAGNDVHLHLANYQQRYLGGAAMIRLYHVDLARSVIDVETVNPFIEAMDPRERPVLAAQQVELSGAADRFTMPLDPETRFAGFAPVVPRPARSAAEVLVPGTAAYWRFDGPAKAALTATTRVRDLSGRGNDLLVATTAGSSSTDLRFSAEHHRDAPTRGSLRLAGPARTSSYLRTVPGAPLDRARLESGYTIEAFVRLPRDFDPSADGFAAVLSRAGRARDAGKAGPGAAGDPEEPVATLSISNLREAQWCAYPTSGKASDSSLTCWGHELATREWWHLAIVNDTRHTRLYVEGCEVLRNPARTTRGLATAGLSWLVGGYEYGGRLDATFRGWIGDVRIVARALAPAEFMNA